MDRDMALALYGCMLRIRRFEEEVDALLRAGELHGTTHLYIGQEAVAAGVMAALGDAGLMVSNHRGHGHALACGTPAKRLMAEMMGREAGVCCGLGGSMHMADVARGNYGANGIVAAGIPVAAGIALAQKFQRTGKVTVAFFGDGATNTGYFHEAANLAQLQSLPLLLVCENNGYAVSTPVEAASAEPDLCAKARAYRIPARRVDGNDVEAVYEAALAAAERIRAGGGPEFLEAVTYRWKGHSRSDALVYRDADEAQRWMARCPVRLQEEKLAGRGIPAEALATARQAAREEIAQAVEYARSQREIAWERAGALA